MCGIIGIYSQEPVASQLYDGLIHLQHRGQDAAGLVSYDIESSPRFHVKHGLGLVQEIFSPEDLIELKGQFGIGHTRYPTAGGYKLSDVQPLYRDSPRQISLAHNGNLINYAGLTSGLTQPPSSSIDSEALLLHLAADLSPLSSSSNPQAFFEALCVSVKKIMQTAQGSYSVLCLIEGGGLIAFRDPHGIRPLVFGEGKTSKGKKNYIFASESSMFYSLGFQISGDVEPGELIYLDLNGDLQRRRLIQTQFSPCIFEYVYFSRPDSVINQASVYQSRINMGQNLARQWKKECPTLLPDIVIPIPFTSNTAALAFANEIGVRYSEGLYKNPFIGRTFIMSNVKKRSCGVRHKLTPQKSEVEGKKVL
ncbi:MAG TPA: amidophosphoribosyltransferase, partial [Gammaproteobacteria bacterium]|nr:amidophosphoribosyltransferase [Gammaproteobacteria bacterium]